jgi:hypothetical protein
MATSATESRGKSGQPSKLFRRPFVQMPLDLLELTGGKKAIGYVYLWLWHYAGEADKAWPGTETLAKKARVNIHDARASITWLADRGYIVKHERKGFTAVYEVRGESAAARRAASSTDPLPRRKPSEPEGVGSNEPGWGGSNEPGSNEPGGWAQMSPRSRTKEQEELTQQPNPPLIPPVDRGETPQAGPGCGDHAGKCPTRARKTPQVPTDTQQAPQAPSCAPETPLASVAAPSSNPVAEAAAKPTTKRAAAARDPFASKNLPATAIPDDLLDCQQLLREWWTVKPRNRTQVAFDRACGLLRRYDPSDRSRMLEAAVIGGYQGLHEMKKPQAVSNARDLGYGDRRLTPAMQSTLDAMAITRGERPGFSAVFGPHAT